MSRITKLLYGAVCLGSTVVLAYLLYTGWQCEFRVLCKELVIESEAPAPKPVSTPDETRFAGTSELAPRDMPVPVHRWDGCEKGDEHCALAEALYFEGRSELDNTPAVRGIAAVVLNRRAHEYYPDSIYGVVHHVRETKGGTLWEFSYQGENHRVVWEPLAMLRAKSLAAQILKEVVRGTFEDPTDGAIFYCMPSACKYDPVSFHPLRRTFTAVHEFYAGGRAPRELDTLPPARPEWLSG